MGSEEIITDRHDKVFSKRKGTKKPVRSPFLVFLVYLSRYCLLPCPCKGGKEKRTDFEERKKKLFLKS